jgi:aspartate/methionine/tyrosine aminotransferase
VFTRAELQLIADLCIQHDCYALSDEVYEHLVFEPHEHISLRTLPGMQERCIRLGSAGKTFSFTAWKVGVWLGGGGASYLWGGGKGIERQESKGVCDVWWGGEHKMVV